MILFQSLSSSLYSGDAFLCLCCIITHFLLSPLSRSSTTCIVPEVSSRTMQVVEHRSRKIGGGRVAPVRCALLWPLAAPHDPSLSQPLETDSYHSLLWNLKTATVSKLQQYIFWHKLHIQILKKHRLEQDTGLPKENEAEYLLNVKLWH